MAPKNHSSVDSKAFVPLEKELVIDIDISDYNDVRTWCEGNNVWAKWWKLMSIAVKIIEAALRDDFDFQNLLWVFSGRRGIHWWVCDVEARKLNNEARTAIVNYLSVYVGNEMSCNFARIENPISPPYQRAKEIIQEDFTEIMMRDQNILKDEKVRERLLKIVERTELEKKVKENWEDYTDYDDPQNSVNLWKVFFTCVQKFPEALGKSYKLDPIASAMFTFVYPRLDLNVSKGINHLLKSPFWVHPKTGKICVPFDAQKVDEFDPNWCPTLCQALDEYDTVAKSETFDKEKFVTVPCLEESFKVFKLFLKSVQKEYTTKVSKENREKLAKTSDRMDIVKNS